MTGPLRYTTRDPYSAISAVVFTDEDSAPILGPAGGFDVYNGLRTIHGFCPCARCSVDIRDMLLRRRTINSRPVRR